MGNCVQLARLALKEYGNRGPKYRTDSSGQTTDHARKNGVLRQDNSKVPE